MADQPRAGHAERMADRDRAAIDVVRVGIDAEVIAAIEALAGERLIEFPQADIRDRQPGAVEQLGDREDRANAHFVRAAARRLKAAIDAEDVLALGLRGGAVHHDLRGGAV